MKYETLFVGGPLNSVVAELPDTTKFDYLEDQKIFYDGANMFRVSGQLKLPKSWTRYKVEKVAVIHNHKLKLECQVAFAPGWE